MGIRGSRVVGTVTGLTTAVALFATARSHAELPDFPANSIQPMYGRWRTSQNHPAFMSIGKHFIVFGDSCPYRYQVLGMRQSTDEAKRNILFIDLKLILVKRESCGNDDRYLEISIVDVGDTPLPLPGFNLSDCRSKSDFDQPEKDSCSSGFMERDR
jgi:hypothetical protein